MADTKKRPVQDPLAAVSAADNLSSKKPKPPHPPKQSAADIFSDVDIFSGFSIDDDTAQELSDLLESPPGVTSPNTEEPPPFRVRFVPYPYLVPPLEHSSSYITINGNEESCGSSFSVDADSSFMASVDPRGVYGGASCSVEEVARESVSDWGCGDGDVWDWNEVLLAAEFLDEDEDVFGFLGKVEGN